MSAIDEVKQRIDIIDVISQYTPLSKSGRNFKARCPFHNEKTPSFFVFPERQSWHCFGACNTGGDAFAFVMKKEGVDFIEALRRLADRAGVVLPSHSEAETRKGLKDRLYAVNDMATRYYQDLLANSPQAAKARDHLKQRGIDTVAVRDFRLGYALESWDALKIYLLERGYEEKEQLEAGLLSVAETGRTFDRWRHRLMIPIMDERGRVTGFGARVLESSTDGPKYINTPQTPVFDKSATLYGLHLAAAAIKNENRAVIVEGYMDVITAHQYHCNNVIASMGTSITEKQVSILKRLSRNLVLAMDSDVAGAEAMQRCVDFENLLEAEIKVIVLPAGKDPDQVIKADHESWSGMVDTARPVIDYTFDVVVAGLDLTKVGDRIKARDRLYPVVEGIKDIVRRAHYLQKLAGMIGVSDLSLEAAMKKKNPALRTKSPPGLVADKKETDSLFKNPVEEYCLNLLLQYPELRKQAGLLPPEYFENSENLEIFLAWRDHDGITAAELRQIVDAAIREHLEVVLSKRILPDRISRKYADCALRLREKYLRNLERKREAVLASEANIAEELVRSKQTSTELKEIFGMKARRQQRLRS